MKALRTAYFIVANTAILLLLVQAGAHVANITHAFVWSFPEKLTDPVKQNYAHLAPADVEELMRTTSSLRFRYEPVLGIITRATASPFVNVDAHGIRANGPTPRDIAAMENAIWFLGGSTTFGIGVADHETIPAQLEMIMKRSVVNLGVSNYSSAAENLLLNRYVRIGYRPAIAIFFDGINEGCQPDMYQDEMRTLFAQAQDGYGWVFGKPVIYALNLLGRKLKHLAGVSEPHDEPTLTCVQDGRQDELRTLYARALAERDALCDLYRIECRTLVQPFAGVHGRHDDAAFLAGEDAKFLRDKFHHLEPAWRAAGATFVTGALDGYDRHAWVDEVHYSAAASRLIAEAIAAHLDRRNGPPVS